MRCNMGKTDRLFRMCAGVGMIGAGIYFGSWWGVVGVLPLLIGASGYCPVFDLFKFNSGCQRA